MQDIARLAFNMAVFLVNLRGLQKNPPLFMDRSGVTRIRIVSFSSSSGEQCIIGINCS